VPSPGSGQEAQDEAAQGIMAVGAIAVPGRRPARLCRPMDGLSPYGMGGSTGKAGAGPESPVAGAGGCGKRLGTAPCSAAPVPCRIEGCTQSN